ncbi:MAG: molecular chaperone HtpG, partial [Akkermansia sp.]
RFIKHLEKLAKDDTETYDTFYTKFSRYLKEGVVTSWANKEALGSLLRFESTFTDVGTNTSFADYVSRMKEDQKAIYVLSGVSRAQMEQSPYMEAFKARGYEVAFFTDHGDEFVIDSLSSIDAKPLTFINKADIELPETNMEGNALTSEDATELNTWLDELYKGKFDKVTIGNRLVSGAAVVLQSNDTMGPEMRAYMKAMGQEVPESHPQLELNPRNELVKKLSELRKDNPELASLVADQITNTALLRAGILDNPGQLAQSSEDLLSKLLLKKD